MSYSSIKKQKNSYNHLQKFIDNLIYYVNSGLMNTQQKMFFGWLNLKWLAKADPNFLDYRGAKCGFIYRYI